MKELSKSIIKYILTMIIIGLWQLIDWYFGSEDPIWHIFFYIIIIPFISFVFGILTGHLNKCFINPFIAYTMTFFVYFFMANGGFSFDKEILWISLFPFGTTLGGIILRKGIIYIEKKMT